MVRVVGKGKQSRWRVSGSISATAEQIIDFLTKLKWYAHLPFWLKSLVKIAILLQEYQGFLQQKTVVRTTETVSLLSVT